MCEWFNMAEKDSAEGFNREQRDFGLVFKPKALIVVIRLSAQTSHYCALPLGVYACQAWKAHF